MVCVIKHIPGRIVGAGEIEPQLCIFCFGRADEDYASSGTLNAGFPVGVEHLFLLAICLAICRIRGSPGDHDVITFLHFIYEVRQELSLDVAILSYGFYIPLLLIMMQILAERQVHIEEILVDRQYTGKTILWKSKGSQTLGNVNFMIQEKKKVLPCAVRNFSLPKSNSWKALSTMTTTSITIDC
nr:hypothetical protein [Tanacetum cinerariifolium]